MHSQFTYAGKHNKCKRIFLHPESFIVLEMVTIAQTYTECKYFCS